MSGLLFLTSDDFNVSKGTRGNILCNLIHGYSLILFYSPQCPHCQKLIPIFRKLPGTINGCQFGMVNVSTNKKCVDMSSATIAPIEYVPYIVFYVNGRPYMNYKGPADIHDIKNFIISLTDKIQNNKIFSSSQNQPMISNELAKHTSHACTIGQPLYGDEEVTYLPFKTAYIKT
jgi:thioredoxin-like negative regulator of GroEL